MTTTGPTLASVDWNEWRERDRRFRREMMLWQAFICVEIAVVVYLAASLKKG